MKFIFEDDERDIISEFFMQAYPKSVSDEFIYAQGNANIKDKADIQLKNTSDTVIAFLDMPPGNREVVKIYSELAKLSKDNQYRFIVLPIICAEYYLIKSLHNTIAMKSSAGVALCINKDIYFNSPIIQTQQDKQFCKNFEKYCKLILMKNTKDCANHSGKTINAYYGVYYKEDCICAYKDVDCNQCKSKINKSIEYISKYPCVPSGSFGNSPISLSVKDVWDIHRNLVNEYNQTSTYYAMRDTANQNKYKQIRPII